MLFQLNQSENEEGSLSNRMPGPDPSNNASKTGRLFLPQEMSPTSISRFSSPDGGGLLSTITINAAFTCKNLSGFNPYLSFLTMSQLFGLVPKAVASNRAACMSIPCAGAVSTRTVVQLPISPPGQSLSLPNWAPLCLQSYCPLQEGTEEVTLGRSVQLCRQHDGSKMRFSPVL